MEGTMNRGAVRKRVKRWLARACFSAACLASGTACAQLIPPVADDWSRGGLSEAEGWTAASNSAGRVTLVGGEALNAFDVAASDINNIGTFFRGNTYAADASATLLGQEFYLARATPAAITFCVYESANTNGPFARVDAVTVYAPAGEGFVSSGQRGVPLFSGRFYAIGAAVVEAAAYQQTTGIALPQSDGDLTCVKGVAYNSTPGTSVDAFTAYNNPYRQRLRVSDACATMPGKLPLTSPLPTAYMRGNVFAATNSTWLLGHGLYAYGEATDQTINLFVYESPTRAGTYNLLDSQRITVPAGRTNFVSASTQIPLTSGRYYLLGGQCPDTMTISYASGFYDAPYGLSWGQALEGFNRSGTPPESVTLPYGTTQNVYKACFIVGDRPAVRMDSSASGAMSTNSLTAVIASASYSDITLAFDHRASADEAQDGDGVFVSSNGSTFTRVLALSGSSSWTHYETNIIALAQSNGVSTTGNLYVRFQQQDDYSWPSDGREFANVRLFARPDLAWQSLAASPTNYLFRGAVTKTFYLAGAIRLAGGDTAVTGQTVNVRHRLYDDQGTVQYSYPTYTPDIPAFGHRLDPFASTVVIPAGTLLTQSLYHVAASLDSSGSLAEGRENNNSAAPDFLVNHYSGALRFSNTAASVTLTGWDFQPGYGAPTYSPERHLITGTGTLAGRAFGFTNLMVRKQMGTCDYVIDPNEPRTLYLSGTRDTTNTVSGVRFVLDSSVALSRLGVTAAATVLMPAGCAFAESADRPWGVTAARIAGGVQLDANLRPTGSYEPSPDYSCFYEESKPLFFEVAGLTWNAAAGTFDVDVSGVSYAHDSALDALDALAASGHILISDAIRRSNDGYYRSVTNATTLTLSSDARGAAQLSFKVDLATNRFRVHMPYNVDIGWNQAGSLTVSNDLPVVSPLVSALSGGLNFGVYYGSGCPGGCSGADNTRLLSCLNDADAFHFTADGGLYAPCSFAGGEADLRWGFIPSSGALAQRAYGFTTGVLHVPGHFLRADDCPAALSDDDTPCALVLSAVGGAGDELVRPHGDGYADGDGGYAGVTVDWESEDCLGETLLGGSERFKFTLDESCKFYVRQTGVSGIHVADSTLGQTAVTLYGYAVLLDNLAFSYLSTENLESRTEGRVSVPSPCGFTVDFEELKLTCMGDLESAEPADPSAKLSLAYWSALVQPATIGFASEDGCAVGNRTLVMDVSTTVDNIPDTLFGRLGFRADGNLSAASDAGAGGDSRLTLPTIVTLPGPSDSTYTLRPVNKAYFNDFRRCDDLSAIGDGLLTFAAELDVPFFENMLVQAFTSADTTGGTSPVYLAGGWPTKGWTLSGQTPFTDAAFDADNAGHPAEAGAPSFSEYLAGNDTDYIPRARREWIAGIGFDIGVRWDASSLSFRSPAPVENDLYVLSTEYNVPQLTAERAEITFGLQYGELPDLNLSSIFFNAVDASTGISERLNSVVGETVTGLLDQGVAALDTLTATDPAELLGNTLADQLDPFVDKLYVALTNAYATGTPVTNTISAYIRGGAGAPADTLSDIFDKLVEGTEVIGTGLGVAEDLQAQIDKAIAAVDAVAVGVHDPEKGLISLLDFDAGNYPIVADLAQVLLIFAMPAMEDAGDAIEAEVNGALETLEPTLDSVRETLVDVRDQLDEVRDALETAGEFRAELLAALDPAQLTDLANTVTERLNAEFAALDGTFSPAQNYTPEELKALIRATIIDALRESAPITELQRIVRARMLDVDRQIRGGIDSVLSQINWAMRETLSKVVGSLDTSISGMVGDFSDVLGTGQVEGYAHIQGDSLDKLRLDLQMQMKVPDEMQFAGYLEIVNEQTSASGGCAFDEGSTYKVTVGAEDVPCSWLGSDVRINCACFFTLNNGVPKGMGGALELVDGTISFESAEITRFGAAVAFGALENYLAAATRVTINDGVELEGGLFFGRTCTLAPILIVDPEVGDLLGEPPFTGAYVYGEGWIPIYDYGCLFRIKAGAGFGVFYFAEGPTYGVHIMLGASGEALCVVSIRGEVDIYGLKQGDSYRARGKGKIKGKVGSCPFCVKFNKTVTITYDDGEWDADY